MKDKKNRYTITKNEDGEYVVNKVDTDKDKYSIMKAASLLTQLGVHMAGCIIVGTLIGKFLDMWLGTSPWLLVIFAFLGSAAAFKVLYDISKDWNE